MKLLYLVSQRFPTEKAYGIQIAKTCEAFSNAGVDTELIVPTRKGKLTNPFEYYGVKRSFRFTRIASPDFYLPGILDRVAFYIKQFISAKRLVSYARKNGADIFYTRDELVAFFLNLSCLQTVVFEAHRFTWSRRLFYRRFLRIGIKIVVISQGIKDEFVKFGFSDNQIFVAHDGVDIEQFDINITKDQARAELRLPRDVFLVGYVGQLKTLGMSKGVDYLIEGFAIFHHDHPKSKLVIVGGAPEDIGESQRLVQRLKIPDGAIIFIGRQAHGVIPKYLKAFDTLVMTYPDKLHFARFMSPLKLFEYMASGRPIIATDLPSIREILNEHNSFLIKPGNPRALAIGIQQFTNNPELASRLAGQALIDVQQHTWQRRVDMILNFIKQQ